MVSVKKLFSISIIIAAISILILMCGGCNNDSEDTAPTTLTTPAEESFQAIINDITEFQDNNQDIPAGNQGGDESEGNRHNETEEAALPPQKVKLTLVPIATGEHITAEEAREMAAEFFRVLDFISVGGHNSPGNFEYDYTTYLYIDEKVATDYNGLKEYFSYIFTGNFTEFYISAAGIVEHEGMLGLRDSGDRSKIDMDKAVIMKEDDTYAKAAYTFELETDTVHIVTFTLHLEKDDGKWLIDGYESGPCPHCG